MMATVRRSPSMNSERSKCARRRCVSRVARVLLAQVLVMAGAASAQESMPRLTFAGSGLASFNVNAETALASEGDTDLATVIDFSDSFLLVRLDRQLFENDRAGVVVGFLFPDEKANLGDVFYNQVQVFYNSRYLSGTLGRSRLSNFLLEFPVTREEDLIEYSFVSNAFSNARNSEFSRYGNVLRGELFAMNARVVLAGQVSTWAVTDLEGVKQDDFDVNTVSGSIEYRLPEGIRYQGLVRSAGLQLVTQNVDELGQEWMTAVIGGAALNLTKNPLRNFELRAQGIYNFGMDPIIALGGAGASVAPLGQPMGRARSESLGLVGSLRFLSRPYQLDRFQAAITGAYKNFVGVDGSQFAIIPNVFFRLGQGVDLGLQYRYEQFNDSLAEQIGRRREHSVQLIVGFRFQMMFNNYFGDRDDILNLEHGYIP